MGNVGKAMSWLMWRETGEDSLTPASSPAREPPLSSLDFDIDPSADTHQVELEWDNWIGDLTRQRRLAALADPITPRPSDVLSSDIPPEEFPHHSPHQSPTSLPTPVSGQGSHEMRRFHPQSLQEALSMDGPALLTTPSLFSAPTSGTTTSTVSVGGVVIAHSRTAVNESGRGRGVPRAMEILPEGIVSQGNGKGKEKEKRRLRERDDDRGQLSSVASSSAYSWISAPEVILPATDGPLERPSSSRSKSGRNIGRRASEAGRISSTTFISADGPSVSGSPNVPISHTTLTVEPIEGPVMTKTRQKKEGFRFKPERLVKGLDSALNFVDGRL